jgi:acetyltransferase-like isoleucine patch superfamily enzyme
MTEKQKMLMGILYNAEDQALIEERNHAKSLTRQFNEHWEDKGRRNYLIGQIFGSLGKNVHLEAPIYLDYGYRTTIGSDFFSNFNLTILDGGGVEIGDHVFIGPNVGIYTANHPADVKRREKGYEWALPVKIGDKVWIGGGVTILPGVTIGDNSVIGAGSVVTKDVPANVVLQVIHAGSLKKRKKETDMGLLTRKTDSNPLSKNIDELLDGMNQEREETKEGTYEESLKKIEERIKELGILEEENED